MGCGTTIVKYSVFLFNLIFVLAGIAFIAVGVIFKLGIDDITESLGDFGDYIKIVPVLIIIIGCVVFVISFMGCCGAIRESTCMLTTYGVLMLILCILQIALGTYAYVTYKNHTDKLNADISKWINNAMDKYGNANLDKGIDKIQEKFKCCGTNGPSSWPPGKVPDSCKDESGIPYKVGCIDLVFNQVHDIVITIVTIVYTIAGIELAAAIVAFCLMSCIRNNVRRGYY